MKTILKLAAHRRVFKEDVKLSAEFESGLLTYTTGNSRVNDRFFLGSRKMRGFDAGGIGPRECSNRVCSTSNNDALGGENFAVARFEAEFPLGIPDEYGLSGGLFYDIGNLWSLTKINNNVLYEDGSWRQAIGASVFWKTPIGPLRFNFSDVLKKEQYDRDESFDLTISTRF
jgi:outer membrane protein insertion porin family